MNAEIQVLAKLDHVRKSGSEYVARCPAHDDKKASLTIRQTEDGTALFYCHAGCSYADIAHALNLPRNEHNGTSTVSKIVATYDYTGLKGQLLYQVVRYDPKAFKQRRPDGKGGWIWDLKGITPTLYRLPEVVAAINSGEMVVCCEGEKDCNSLFANKIVATTISGGASSKWHPALITLFENANVCVIPDNDESGLKYAQYVANSLSLVTSHIKMVVLPIGKDASDYLEKTTVTELLALVNKTPYYEPKGTVTREEFNTFTKIVQYQQRQIMGMKERRKARSKYD